MFYPAFSLNGFSKPKMNLFRSCKNGYLLPGQVVNTLLHISFCVEFACSPSVGFHLVLWFSPQSKNMQYRWIGDAKLSVGVNACVCESLKPCN